MHFLTFLFLATLAIPSSVFSSDCVKYLAAKNAVDGVESTHFTVRARQVTGTIDWNYLIYSPMADEVVKKIPSDDSAILPEMLSKLSTHRLLVKKLQKPFCPECFNEIAREANEQVWLQFTSSDGIFFVGTTFNVQFKPEMTLQEIHSFNEANGVQIIRKLPLGANCFLVKLKPKVLSHSIDMANRYHESGKVVFAEPELATIIVTRD